MTDRDPQSKSSPVVPVVLASVLAAAVGAGLMFFLKPGPPPGGPEAGGPGGGPGGPPGGPPPALVRLASAEMKTVRQHTRIVGQLEAVRDAVVASEVEGRVVRVPVEIGGAVTGGETLLAEIDEVFQKLDLAAAEADVVAAEATLERAESDLAELEQLMRRNSATQKELSDQRSQVKADRARLQAAIAARDLARERVERLRIVAPFDGVVTAKITEVGQWLEEGGAVAEVASRGEIEAVIDVPEQFVNVARVGLPVTVIVEPLGMTRVEGEVVSVNPRGAEAARTFSVEVRLDDLGGRLKPGMSVIAELPLDDEAERLTVPRDAVRFAEGGGATVWAGVEMGGEMAQGVPLPVRVLFGSGPDFVVEPMPSPMGPPLSAGMPIVVEGAERLFPTQPLQPLDAGPAPPPAADANGGPGAS